MNQYMNQRFEFCVAYFYASKIEVELEKKWKAPQ